MTDPDYQIVDSPVTGSVFHRWGESRFKGGPAPVSSHSAEFDIHGVVGVRVVFANEAEASKLLNLLSPFRGALDRDPDIVVRFFDPSENRERTLVGEEYAAFTEEHFEVLRAPERRTEALVPFDRIGPSCELWYESGTRKAPLFSDVVRLIFLAKGYVPVHGSAFVWQGRGVLVTGWARGGKTRTLLAFAQRGARFISDDWVMLSGDGQMLSFPTNVTLWPWQVEQIRGLMPQIKVRKRLYVNTVQGIDRLYRSDLSSRLMSRRHMETVGKILSLARRRLKVSRSPESVFEAIETSPHSLDLALVVLSHTIDQTTVRPCEKSASIERIIATNHAEWRGLLDYYVAYKFAFPHKLNPLLEDIDSRQRDLLNRALGNIATYEVLSPYPADFNELFSALEHTVAEAPGLNTWNKD